MEKIETSYVFPACWVFPKQQKKLGPYLRTVNFFQFLFWRDEAQWMRGRYERTFLDFARALTESKGHQALNPLVFDWTLAHINRFELLTIALPYTDLDRAKKLPLFVDVDTPLDIDEDDLIRIEVNPRLLRLLRQNNEDARALRSTLRGAWPVIQTLRQARHSLGREGGMA